MVGERYSEIAQTYEKLIMFARMKMGALNLSRFSASSGKRLKTSMHRNSNMPRKHMLMAQGILKGWSLARMMVIKVVKDRKERLINSYLLLYWVWGLGLEDHCWAFGSMSRLDYTNVRVGFMPKLVNAVCCVEMDQLVWCLYSDDW
ncbi:hypothetical protein MRB53_034089 [Persea americana]|uniref:Uncharacterized protein n=1 Tax=Persea americana TaxID=3435 RepID=A0ACC2KXQ4_PERAE|nr:hypothetical protein MRB53_034089 [Persea americana]